MRTETTAQRYLWLNRHAVVKGIQITSPSFICILKDSTPGAVWYENRNDNGVTPPALLKIVHRGGEFGPEHFLFYNQFKEKTNFRDILTHPRHFPIQLRWDFHYVIPTSHTIITTNNGNSTQVYNFDSEESKRF